MPALGLASSGPTTAIVTALAAGRRCVSILISTSGGRWTETSDPRSHPTHGSSTSEATAEGPTRSTVRSEERRVGKECRWCCALGFVGKNTEGWTYDVSDT